MKRTTLRMFATATVMSLLSGCATTQQNAMLEGCGGGALIGAAAGAALGAIFGGGKGAAIGAAAGGALGAAGGCAYAYNLSKDYEQLAGHENDLNAQLAFAQGVNQKSEAYNKQLRNEVVTARQEVDELQAKLASNQAQQSELTSQRKKLQGQLDSARKAEGDAQLALNKARQLRSNQAQSSPALDAEIAKLESTVSEMKANTTALAAQKQRI